MFNVTAEKVSFVPFFLSIVTFNKVLTYTPYTLNSIHGTCATSLGLVTILIFWNCTILVNVDAEGLCCHPVDDARFDGGSLYGRKTTIMLTSFIVVIKRKS